MTVSLPDLLGQAVAHHQAGRLADAEPLYRDIIARDPNHAEAHRLLGALLLQRGEAAGAISTLEHALALGANDAPTLSNLGHALNTAKRFGDALVRVDAAVAIAPDYAPAHNNRGLALRGLKRFGDAHVCFETALKLQPGFPDALVNLGQNYIDTHRAIDAVALYSKLLATPSHAEVARFNRAKALAALNRYEEALADYESVQASGGARANAAAMAAAMIHLLLGRFETGWPLYESRWQAGINLKRPPFTQPLWLGHESLAGKTILLHAEQGFGDTLQFVRYVSLVKAQAAKVYLIVQPQLLSLLQPLWPDVQMFTDTAALPLFDVHCPLLSLPLAFQTTVQSIPATVPYITADPEKSAHWRSIVVSDAPQGHKTKRAIGLVWSGRPTHVNDTNRSVGLEALAPLFSLSSLQQGNTFHALQNSIVSSDRPLLAQFNVTAHDAHLKKFADTAALIAGLDLVITVDTSVAHLAGAMGKPVWVLLPFDPDFRWLLDRDDSPWYPTARLFRQPKSGDWTSVIANVRDALQSSA